MKKFVKGLFALGLVAALGSCGPATSSVPTSEEPVEKVWVTFFVNEVGGIFEEVEVEVGTTVDRPATDPTREGWEFVDWYVGVEEEDALFDFDVAITEDTDIYAHWDKLFVPDTREWQLVGSFKNTAYPNEWVPNDPTMQMADIPDDDLNIFKITLELGQYAQFKVKIMEDAWGVEANFSNYDPLQYNTAEIVVDGGGGNLQVTTAGNYEIYWDSDFELIAINRLGDAVGEGVVQDVDPGAIKEWALVGDPNEWTEVPAFNMTHNAQGTEYTLLNVVLVADEAFAFRADAAWTFKVAWGGVSLTTSAEGMLVNAGFLEDDPATTEVDESTLPNPDSDIKVVTTGIYSFKLTWVEEKAVLQVDAITLGDTLGLAGDFNGFAADGHVMTMVSDETNPDVKTYTYTYTDLVVEADGGFKVKPLDTWEVSFGDNGANKAITAGTHTITLVLEVNLTVAARGLVFTLTIA
ncbi:MAG: InlB B-repeat-containing protein [Bacilli bacterium]|nr:InlB B-repeat-containing protein [Bacilli bacterium]